MNDTHTITVLQDDIDHATPGSAENCPLALAAKRDLDAEWVHVGCWTLTALRDGREKVYPLPREATEFVCRFDKRRPVEPFKFEMIGLSLTGPPGYYGITLRERLERVTGNGYAAGGSAADGGSHRTVYGSAIALGS